MTFAEYAEELAALNRGLAVGDLDWAAHLQRMVRIWRSFVAEHDADAWGDVIALAHGGTRSPDGPAQPSPPAGPYGPTGVDRE
jgi:hypothetical protein